MTIALPAAAADLVVKMQKVTPDGTGEALGTIGISSVAGGAALTLDLHGLPPGPHGFHAHENDNCGPTLLNGTRVPAGAAGGHFDPDHTSRHADRRATATRAICRCWKSRRTEPRSRP